MKISKYKSFIEEQLKPLADQHKMQWKEDNEYLMVLENQHVEISFFTERGKDNNDFGVVLTKKDNDNSYTIADIIDLKVGDNSYLTEGDKNQCLSFNDNAKVTIYVSKLVFSNYCEDILAGDFSQIS